MFLPQLGTTKIFWTLLAGSAAIITFLWWRLDAVSEDRALQKVRADTAEAAIKILTESAAINDTVLSEVRAARAEVRASSQATQRAIQNLEAENEAVRIYLEQSVPPDLAAILWPDDEDYDGPAGTPG